MEEEQAAYQSALAHALHTLGVDLLKRVGGERG